MGQLTIKQLRRAKGISIAQMAEICDVHINTFRVWEENPGDIKITYARLIAEALGITLDEFIFMSLNTN